MSDNQFQPRRLGGATGSTSTGGSANQMLGLKTKKGILSVLAFDESGSTADRDLYKLIAMAQNAMLEDILGFEKRGMIQMGQLAFASNLRVINDLAPIEQAVYLDPDVNYSPNGGTCLWYAHQQMVSKAEAQAATMAAGGYSYNRVYLTATDLDGDTASQYFNTTPDMARAESEEALATGKATLFYFGVGGSSVQDHMKFASMLGIPREFVYAIEPNTPKSEIGKWARHVFGLFSTFLQSKSVAIAAGQNGPTNLGGNPWQKPGTP